MTEKLKIDAEWFGEGSARTLFAVVPLEAYGEAPDPFTDYAAWLEWQGALDARLHALADEKAGGPKADH